MVNGNGILLRRENKLLIPSKGQDVVAKSLLATFNINLQNLGYTLSAEALDQLLHSDVHRIGDLMRDTLATLKELRGVRHYRPMYPNFPEQVMEASQAELYLNAILHYFTTWAADVTGDPSIIYLPQYTKRERAPLQATSQVPLIVLYPGKEEDLRTIASRLATANSSLSESDKTDLEWLIGKDLLTIGETIPNKENLAALGAIYLSSGKGLEPFASHFKTATDVLRLAVAISKGDVSLSEKTQFVSFTTSQRTILLRLLNGLKNLDEDMARRPATWKRLGERLHPGEYAKKYPNAFQAFQETRNGKFRTFAGRVEMHFERKEWAKAAALLQKRPGVFARQLDHLIRNAPNVAEATKYFESFAKVAGDVSTPVLLQVSNHFKHRETDQRVIFPKGSVSKVYLLDTLRAPMPEGYCRRMVEICEQALVERFRQLPPMGNVFVSPELANYPLPFSQRSANASLRTLVRGSRPKIEGAGDTIRFFIWWKQSEGLRCDIDLSCVMFDSEWSHINDISYFNLRSTHPMFRAYHSGDITSAPEGACEFIDIDMTSAMDVRYLMMCVNSFTGQKFNELPECFAGWMLRSQPQSGEIFEPKTVQDRVDLTSASLATAPLIIDIWERRVIWMDASYSPRATINNVAENRSRLGWLGKAYTQMRKPNLEELLLLHAEARGTLVQDPQPDDVLVFSERCGIQYDLAGIMSEYMTDGWQGNPPAPNHFWVK